METVGVKATVAALIRLLDDKDPATRSASAVALGKIGGPESVKALMAALDKASEADRINLADSCLKCAEQYRAAGNQAEARTLYERLRASDVPKAARMAALRGILRINQPLSSRSEDHGT